jgi:hypothetical protein
MERFGSFFLKYWLFAFWKFADPGRKYIVEGTVRYSRYSVLDVQVNR